MRVLPSLPQLILFIVLATSLVLAERAPARFAQLMQEDGIAEWATFLAFALAAARGARSLRRRFDLPLLLLVLFCAFVAGEEISWGQRILGFRPPALFLAHNYQQESNLHNLLKGVFETRWMVLLVAFGYGVIAPYLASVTRWPRSLAAPIAYLPWFAAVAWLELAYPYELVGELAELMLGLALLADVHLRSEAPDPAPRRLVLAQASALLGALSLMPLYTLSLSLHTDDLIAHTRSELDALALRIRDGEALRPALFEKRDVHKRMYTAVKAGYLALDPDEFYLDAWNSPYWVSFQRSAPGRGVLRLYSFGPNRKRDLDLGQSASAGDDVQLAIEVEAQARAHAQR